MVAPGNRCVIPEQRCSCCAERTTSLGAIQPGSITKLLALLLVWYALVQGGLPVDKPYAPVPADRGQSTGSSTDGVQSTQTSPATIAAQARVLSGKVVAIDPGHGGAESGATGVAGSREKDNALSAALAIKRALEEVGVRVVLTREGDYEPNLELLDKGAALSERLQQRVRIAARAGADVFISVHNDWNPNPALTGTTTYYWGSPRLAQCVQDGLVSRLGSRNVGVLRKGFHVIVEASMPAVLVELGFLSNAEEEKLLRSRWYHALAGEGIRDGLARYFGG